MATPAQIDGNGAANLSGLGPWEAPKVAFGGTRGMPDARAIHFVLPVHSDRQLVSKVDFVSTTVASRKQPAYLFTELCVMRWDHAATAWELIEVAPDHVLEMIQKFDPMDVRDLDFIAGRKAQLDAYARIYDAEKAMIASVTIREAKAWS